MSQSFGARFEGVPRRAGWVLLTPLATLGIAALVAAAILLVTGYSPVSAATTMWSKGWELETVIDMLNRATPLYLSAIAVAIGFRMNIFNIGVEGQYILAALVAAYVGAQFSFWAAHPPYISVKGGDAAYVGAQFSFWAPVHIAIIILVAMATGAAWVAIPAILKVTRGIHEVISTIMMNIIGVAFVAAVLFNSWSERDALNQKTPDIPETGRMPDLNNVVEFLVRDIEVWPSGNPKKLLGGFLAVAVAVGIIYHIYVNRTRSGYDLRAGGINPDAALVAGINPKKMILTAMLMSGAVAGLVGLPEILGGAYHYDLEFTQMLGFNGIAVALIGQNHAAGVALGAFLFGFLDTTGPILDTADEAPQEIVTIIKGAMIFVAIIVYAIARRQQLADQARAASRVLAQRVRGERENGQAPMGSDFRTNGTDNGADGDAGTDLDIGRTSAEEASGREAGGDA